MSNVGHTHTHTHTHAQVVMSPHEQAEEFISSYNKLMQGDSDVSNFQKVLEMKVSPNSYQPDLSIICADFVLSQKWKSLLSTFQNINYFSGN